jgi:hypothetical protein
MRALQASLLALSLLVGALGRAGADEPPAKCSVRIIQALHDGAEGIDPKISLLRPYLQKAPFTAWNSFKLLDDKEIVLAPRSASTFELPNGRQATLTYVGHLLVDGKHRLRLQLGIAEQQKRVLHTTFVLNEGGVVMEAGQRFQGGLLILGISCQTQD